MKRKRKAFPILALAMLFLLVAMVLPVQAGTISVDINDGSCVSGSGQPDPYAVVYCNIQDAITDSTAADIINVAAGTYNERLTINKSVDLLGAQTGVDPTQPGARVAPAAESIITEAGLSTPDPDVLIEIASGTTNVVVDGFTLNGDPTNTTADTSTLRIWDDHISVSNNIIDGMHGVLYKGNDYLTVDQNRITANKLGVTVQPSAATHVTVSNNDIGLSASPIGGESAIYWTGCTDCEATGNTASGFDEGNGVGGSNLTNITVSGNDFSDVKKGVNFWGTTTFVDIEDNDISSCSEVGINIKGQDINITGNSVNGCDVGVEIDEHVLDTLRVTINDNDLSGNATHAIDVAASHDTIDAEDNWWGSANGPEHLDNTYNVGSQGDGAVGDMDFVPWLDAAPPGGVSFAPVTCSSPSGAHASVQAAVDACDPGATVSAVAGTYAEYLYINKDGLTIDGAGIDQSIIDLDGLTPYWHYGMLSSSFSGRGGVSIDGYLNTGGTANLVENVTFKGFTVKNAGVNPPVTTGAHDGSDNAAVLTDSSASWATDELVGQWLTNSSDYIDNSGGRQFFRAQITGNTATTVTATYVSGGNEKDWDTGDGYVISAYREWYDGALDGRDDVRGIRIVSGKGIVIEDCKVETSGGTGITTGRSRFTPKLPSENITVSDCDVLYNHHGGISTGNTQGTITLADNTVSYNNNPATEGCILGQGSWSTYEPDCHVTGMHIGGHSNSAPLSGTISGNTVENNAYIGIVVYRYTDGIVVENNTATGHNLNSEGAGIFLTTGWGFDKDCKNHTVRTNTVTDNIRGIVAYFAWGDNPGDLKIEGNTVTTDSGAFDTGQAAIKIDRGYNLEVKTNNVSCDGVGIRVHSSESHDNTFTGNTVDGAMFAGVYITSGAYDNTFTGNTFKNTTSATFTGYSDWGSHDGSDNVAMLSDSTQSWTVDSFAGMTIVNITDGSSGSITSNTANTVVATLSGGSENDWDNSDDYDITFDETQADGVFLRGGSWKDVLHAGTGNVFHQNGIHGNAGDGMENQTSTTTDAEENWWGDASGPGPVGPGSGDSVSTYVDYSPWLGATPTTSPVTWYVNDSIQDAIDAASDGDTIHVLAGTYAESLDINKEVTLLFDAGVVLAPSSPCATVNADNVTLSGTSALGPICEPSAGSDGFVTGKAVNNLVIKNWEIRNGTGSSDGIHIGHNVNNLQIFDNWIHDMGGDGVEYLSGTSVTGVHEVQGNLFQDNGGYGVNNGAGNPSYDVTYNSWGDLGGPTVGSGDGVNGSLTYTPDWTHVGLSMVSSGSPNPDEVGVGYPITYTINLDAWTVWGADFDLAFDETKLEVQSISNLGSFDQSTGCSISSVVDANASGVISFCGSRPLGGSPLSDTSPQPVFEVVFEGLAPGTSNLTFDATDDQFSMVPPSGASTNIYAAELNDGAVTVYGAETVTGRIDLQGRGDDTGAVMTFDTGINRGYGPYTFGAADYWGAISQTGVVHDTYDIGVVMERYLDVMLSGLLASGIDVTISGPTTMSTLVLWGGDVNNSGAGDGVIELADATVVGSAFGTTPGPSPWDANADINADNSIDILDLSILGGNYLKDSGAAYSWVP